MDSLPAQLRTDSAFAPKHRRFGRVRAIVAEPLAQFLVLGGLLFGIWSAFGNRALPVSHIVIPAGQMERAISGFTRIHLRSPDASELRQLADDEVSDEVYFREGMALGLDRDDEIIRRRIKQKLQFMTQDLAADVTPTDKELRTYFAQHSQEFGGEPSLSFSQVYLDPTRHKNITQDAASLRDRLNADAQTDFAALSDVLPVPTDFEPTEMHRIADIFGQGFATALATEPPGRWVGPITSGFGQHLVLVRTHADGKAPDLADVRDAVMREWQEARRTEINRSAYAAMRAKFTVQVEFPHDQPGTVPAVSGAMANGD